MEFWSKFLNNSADLCFFDIILTAELESYQRLTAEKWNSLVHCNTKQGRTKVIIEKSRGGRFLRNRNWDLGLIWANWQYRKKSVWADYEQLLRVGFSCLQGQNKMLIFFLPMKTWKNRPQKLPNRPKSSPNLNSCSIKISHRATSL